MRYVVLGLSALALASCSKAPESSQVTDEAAQPQISDNAGSTAPGGIALTAAPGVAFTYHYAFRLPADAIAQAQEAHAQGCEKLGIARCRITGMRYRLIGENNIEAMLAFKLDPSIARLFGKNAVGQVQAAKGTLTDAEINGNDAGAAIDRLAVQRARTTEELARLDAELAKADRKAGERVELQAQRQEVARQIAATADATAEQRESLATTPMVFDYGSGPAVRGFDASAPFTSALDTASGSAQATLAIVLGAIAIFGPPAIARALLWLLYRRIRPWLPKRTFRQTDPQSGDTA